jgi:hypothetical protein
MPGDESLMPEASRRPTPREIEERRLNDVLAQAQKVREGSKMNEKMKEALEVYLEAGGKILGLDGPATVDQLADMSAEQKDELGVMVARAKEKIPLGEQKI